MKRTEAGAAASGAQMPAAPNDPAGHEAPPASGAKPRLRRDAERNRERILESARIVFAAHGIQAGLNDIARHAGVGVGTVYRRFPDKDVLVELALREHFEALVALLDEESEGKDAWESLTRVIRHAVAATVANRGLRDLAFSSGPGRERVAALRDGIAPRLDRLLSAARAQGTLRPEITVSDLIMLTLMLTEFARRSSAVHPDAYRRYLELMISSLRATSESESLPVRISETQGQAIAAGWSETAGATLREPRR